jgi:hypothetical protein
MRSTQSPSPAACSHSSSNRSSRGRSAFLTAGRRIIGGVEIEDDLFRRLFMHLNEQIHQQPFAGRRITSNLVKLAT